MIHPLENSFYLFCFEIQIFAAIKFIRTFLANTMAKLSLRMFNKIVPNLIPIPFIIPDLLAV